MNYKETLARFGIEEHRASHLTPWQKKVARTLLSSGATTAQIGAELGLSRETVVSHLTALRDWTGQDSTIAAAMFIMRRPELLAEVFEL